PDVAIAEKGLAAALWELESVKARIAADRMDRAIPRDSKGADILAWEARRIERQAALRQAEATLARAEKTQQTAKPAEKNKADQQTVKAREALEAAKLAAIKPSGRYTPLSP